MCRLTCHMLGCDRITFVDMLERNNGEIKDIIDTFLNTFEGHERSYALVFHREDSTNEVWRLVGIVDEEEFDDIDDDENDRQLILNVNETIDENTIYKVGYVFEHARLSSGDSIQNTFQIIQQARRLLAINQFDGKKYRFERRLFDEAQLYCEYRQYSQQLYSKPFIYFIRTDTEKRLQQPSTLEETDIIMSENLIYGIIPNKYPLFSLVDILSSVFENLLQLNDHKITGETLLTDSSSNLRSKISSTTQLPIKAFDIKSSSSLQQEIMYGFDDYIINETNCRYAPKMALHRFHLQLQSTLRQMQGEFQLHVPIQLLNKNLITSGDETEEEYIENLEYLIYDWETILHQELNNELSKKVTNSSPLAELEFWKERSIRMTSLLEQMKKEEVLRIINILREIDSPSLSGYNNIRVQLNNYLSEAQDNYKFLLTMERHLKTLQMGSSFQSVINILPNLMQGLKTIWTMSKYYNKDERMVPFMEKMAHEIINRVRQTIDITTIFSNFTLNEAKERCENAKQLLLQWKKDYNNTRLKLETDKRGILSWNFDYRILFEKTDYMAQICDDLIKMAMDLDEFYDIFGPDMKAVTGEEEMVDKVLEHVGDLKKAFSLCYFDIFDRLNQQRWQSLIDEFNHRSTAIEQEAKMFIRASFTQLRSAEGAFDMLIKFQKIGTGHVLSHEMIRQFTAILVQYRRELDTVREIFLKHNANPPVFKVSSFLKSFSYVLTFF
ncbi:unnamed protein product [Didymodactylos carnosus]|uniref:Dynein heavy chain tail domain-containing protein n=1 Tax=Didymodactylos carnosus TaxID=1234261 RepID=A0A815B2W1_9BILA|nr:unnamed protein product [Didymodactylos carnosus]CAF1265128.1 unnamed protein product [Didymodactylos carnosus]CAF3823791.1 unnamed protein product [Didymodactylos carnosus]CAF4047130.1 unnamed protein product [Didymodactylos carnosus]